MQNSRNTRATTVIVAGIAIAIAGRLLDWSLVTIFLLLAALIIVLWLITYWQTWRTLAWFRRYNLYSTRLRQGDTDSVIAELRALREAGDRSPELAITLAAAYNYLGRGMDAEPLAFEAFERVATGGDCGSSALSTRAKCDLAYLTRFDALLAQGRFTEAAGGLREHIPHALQPNFLTALTAWAYALGGDEAQTRDILARVKAPGTRVNNERLLSPRFEFTTAYLRHALTADRSAATLNALQAHREMVEEWQATANRNSHNPYGARVQELVDDMRAQLTSAAVTGGNT